MTELKAIVSVVYIILFVMLVAFFEYRLDYIHRQHVDKIWPVGEDGLKIIDHKLKITVRLILAALFAVSFVIIFTLL